MSVLTMPAQPDQDTAPRPVPWRRMAWITWRQQRATLIAVPAVLAAVAVFLVIFGLKAHHDYAALVNCPLNQGRQSNACAELFRTFNSTDWPLANACSILIGLAPVLIGAFAGAPLLARELENGTYRFAWTQGAGRTRWALSTLVLPAMLLTAVTGAFTALLWWYFRPFLADGQVSEFLPLAFALLGVAFAAWTLFAYALAAFTGTLFRRTVPAMAVTLIVYIVLAIATATAIRPHYEAPVTVAGWNQGGGAGWVISSWVKAPNGQHLSQAAVNSLRVPASVQNSQSPDAFTNWLTSHGYTLWQSVQPDSRFWQFQLTEGGWLLAVSALLIGGAVWLIRRRGA